VRALLREKGVRMSRRFPFLILLLVVAALGVGASAGLQALERMYDSTTQLDEFAGELRNIGKAGGKERQSSCWCLVDAAGNVLGRGEEAERVFFAMVASEGADMAEVVSRLRANRNFQSLWSYLSYQRREIRLQIDPAFTNPNNGKPLFGGYNHESRTILINTAHPTVAANPLELVDTLIHECIHAALHNRALNEKLERLANVTEPMKFTLPEDIADAQSDSLWQDAVRGLGLTVHDIRKLKSRPVGNDARLLALKKELDFNYGASSSDPDNQYEDINLAAQTFLVHILQDVRLSSGLPETISFGRLQRLRIARNDPLLVRKRA
jgi:hypothetical protein